MEETGEDQEPHGQTTSRSGWEILEGMVEGERDGKTKSHMDKQHQGVDGKYWREWWRVKETGRPRATWTDNIKEWMGNIGGNGGR